MSKRLKGTPDRVWLAGLGALAVAEQEGNDLFQQLVKKGRDVEKRIQAEVSIPVAGSSRKYAVRRLLATGKLVASFEARSGTDPRAPRSRTPAGREAIAARQARWLAAAKRAVLKEFGSPVGVGDCERLLQERKIFAVSHRNTLYVPSFQFDEKGHPRPAVAKVIQILGKDTSDWGLALWFTAANGWLDDKRPVDLLKDEPEEVIQAAEQEAAELVF